MRDVDLDVAHGERRAILGPNGAGKTTLFNCISGDVAPSSGTIEFDGQDTTGYPPPYRTKMGMARTYQKSRLFLGLTVEDNLYLGVLGVEPGHLRPFGSRARDEAMRERRPRARAARRAQQQARHARRLALARRAASARGGHGADQRPRS